MAGPRLAASRAKVRAPDARALPARLIRLASQATHPAGWSALRAYAGRRPRGVVRGYAYFALGYRECKAGLYPQAERDLARAAADEFPLRDLAVYYLAQTDYRDGQTARVVGLLHSFAREFPGSTALTKAIGLLAWAYLQSGQAAKAVRTLTSYPRTFQRSDLSLQLALAYEASGAPLAAARLDQDIYYAFPTTPEANVAAEGLRRLKATLRAQYPRVSDRIVTARAQKLFAAGRFDAALKEYARLLRVRPRSPERWEWILGKALCLLRLNQEPAAIQVLRSGVPLSPALNAERERLLVEAYMDTSDEKAMNRALDQLRIHHPDSPWYAQGLYSAASDYLERGNVNLAAALYRNVAGAFPNLPLGEDAAWRAAWLAYFKGASADARAALLDYIERYPSSLRTAGALYFLGRLAEDLGDPREARELYQLLRRRYGHGYYALRAADRLGRLAKVKRMARNPRGHHQALDIRKLTGLIPPPRSLPFNPCVHPSSEVWLRPYLALASLSLRKLASECLRGLLRDRSSQPDLIFALSRIEAERGRPDRGIYLTRKLIGRYQDASFRTLPRSLWALLYPRSFWALVDREARQEGLDPYLIMALIREESGFYPKAVSPAHALGLMQILDRSRAPAARALAARLGSPWYNVRAGCAYLRGLMKRYHGNLAVALAAYNAGPTRVDDWLRVYSFRGREDFIEMIPFPGTRIYVRAVLRDQILYRRMLAGRVSYMACTPRRPEFSAHRGRLRVGSATLGGTR